MKLKTAFTLTLLGTAQLSLGALIAQQDFEVVPAGPVATYTSTGTVLLQSGSVGGSSTPAASTWGADGSGGATWAGVGRIQFTPIDTTSFTNVAANIRLAALSGNATNGLDISDTFTILISPDGGSTFYERLVVTGANSLNAKWTFAEATGIVTDVYSPTNSPTVFNAASSGVLTGSAAPTFLTITGLPAVSQLVVRVVSNDNSVNENWLIDNYTLTGDAVPEPSAALLGGLGLLALVRRRRC